ncbi:ABC transporter ATP-binding protein [Evansella clarkii]|uniref:ABC transporter ATP-binding protein n=1 Tax=Evansella clarkii TaxID=79879 RepID=UPI00106674BC|nr:ABC transporter ATP-binding protein [Evansella clarkii]
MIIIEDLSFTYNNTNEYALNKIKLHIHESDTVFIMGQNGSGKSTLLYSINGLIPGFYRGDITGNIIVNGSNDKRTTVELSKDAGFLFQDFDAQLFSTVALQDLAFGLENLNVEPKKMKEIIAEHIETFNLEEIVTKSPSNLSGGQKQKVALVSTLVMDQPILMCDEPTTDLDPKSKEEILNYLLNLNHFKKKTLLVAEHETEYAREFDKLLVLKGGKVIYYGSPKEGLANLSLLELAKVKPLQITEFLHKYVEGNKVPTELEEAIEFMQDNNMNFKSDEEHLENDNSNNSSNVIEIQNLSFSYNESKVINNINLNIKKGGITAIMGQNGSGKSTLVKLIIGLLDYEEGSILIDKVDRKNFSLEELSNKIGFLFQNPDNQIFNETVYSEVAYSIKDKNNMEQKISEILELVNLSDKREEDPFTLTKNEKQKLALATILIREPDILILDEPTTGLDYKEQREILSIINRLSKLGHTVILITHSNWIAAEYADEIIVFSDGNILLEGPTREVFWHGEKLLEANITLPEITQLGLKFGELILSVDEAKQRLIQLKEKEKNVVL